MVMTSNEFDSVLQSIVGGTRFTLGRNAVGRVRLKLYSGPFGIFAKRYGVDETQLQLLRNALSERDGEFDYASSKHR